MRRIAERLPATARRPTYIFTCEDEGYSAFATRDQFDYKSLRNFLLALFFVFRITDDTTWNDETLRQRQHPPAPFRFHVVCIHLADHFKRSGDIDGERQLQRAKEEVWELGEALFARTLGRTPDDSIKHNTLSGKNERHYERLSERAKSMPQHLFGLVETDHSNGAFVST